MDDRDVIIIEEYIRRYSQNLELNPKDTYVFEVNSYSSWAANEVLERVIHETMKLPPYITGNESLTLIDVVEAFIDEMDYYAYLASNEQSRKIFEIARDEGKCILMYINSPK